MWNHGFNYTHTCQQIPFSLLNTSQAGQECEQRKSALVTWTSRVWAVLHSPSQTFTVITFPWFLLCDSCLVNIAAGIHYLIFSLPVLFFSSPLGECQSTMCGLFHYVNSCCVLLRCLFLARRCMILPSGLGKKKPFDCFTVILIKEKM